jgi:hypothetical protein
MRCGKTLALKERKSTKKKEIKGRGGLWKLPQPRKSITVAFGNILLDDFLCRLENPAGFPHCCHKPGGDFNH